MRISSSLRAATEIYKVNYAFNNLYTVEITVPTNENTSVNSLQVRDLLPVGINERKTEDMNNYLKFQSPAVSFNGESLNLERNFATKKFQVNNYSRSDTLNVTWREADDWRVKKYHEDWMGLIYNRNYDCYISHDNPAGIYRIITIKLGDHRGVRFYNVIPQNNGNIDLSWNTSPAVVSHSITYYIEDWEWLDNIEEEDL